MLRRTKIVATLGPATDPVLKEDTDGNEPEYDYTVMNELVDAGVNVVRINCSHGTHKQHKRQIEAIRSIAWQKGRQVGVLLDLMGPKIRIGKFKDDEIELIPGEKFTLDITMGGDDGNKADGTSDAVGVTYKGLINDVNRGDTLLLNDGLIDLWVEEVNDTQIQCRVVVGGILSNSKGINRKDGGISAGALTKKDHDDIRFAAEIEADYIAVSFARHKEDIQEAKRLLEEAGGKADVVAKIERAEAVKEKTLKEIILESDAIMIARGDLGVEVGDAELPALQKKIIKMSRDLNRVVITATQMMESMIFNQIPTRAEVFDVANAVLDGTDAVMLSAETATGMYPAKSVAYMDRICRHAERQPRAQKSHHRIDTTFTLIDEAIAMGTMYTANHLKVKAIAALTESGATVKWMSRISSGIPIYALSKHVATRRKVTLYRGVYPVSMPPDLSEQDDVIQEVIDELLRQGTVRMGDMVIITKGDKMGKLGGTNTMQIVRIGEE
jgi:pyruvate kinase